MNSPILAIDFGFQRTGLALSESGLIARPLKTIEADQPHMHSVLAEIIEVVKEYEVVTIVVGLPYTEDGQDTSQSLRINRLIDQLRSKLEADSLTAPIITTNEFYSTEEAKTAFPDAPLDAAAAAVILQHLLDQI